jgi:hypothetical protein
MALTDWKQMADQDSLPFFDLSCRPLCKACSGETRTIYVHLTSGTRLKVENVREVEVMHEAIIIQCGVTEPHAVEFRREDVYFTSCEQCLPPPAS